MIRMFELFAGIGATSQAIEDLNLDFQVVGISEIDKNAIQGYEAIHGPVKNYGDITKIKELPEVDLLTYTYPCQSVSIAGLREGMKEAIDRLMEKIPAKTNLYRLAGNSIPVCLLRAIFRGIYLENSFIKTNRQITLNYWEE